jgi:hypothetical protein
MFEDWKWHHTRREDPRDLGHSEQPARVARASSTTPQQSAATAVHPLPVEASLGGFIVWLARHHSPAGQRGRCVAEVSRFLCWQRDQREHDVSHLEDDYYTYMQRTGSNVAEVVQARSAIELFRRYLRTTD